MSDSVRPHRRQTTRHPHPWDSPGHFLLQCMKMKSDSEVAQSCPTLSDPMDCSSPGSSIHGIFQARVLEWGAISFCTGKQWALSKPWKGEGGAGELVSEGSARCVCFCLGKQASLCPLPHPCPSAELTAREKFVVKRAAGKLFLGFPKPH